MNPSRMQKLHKECWEKVISGKDETMQNRKEIVMINVANIYPHPDNPRKDVGDVTELAESIKKQGVMQNLTVIPLSALTEELEEQPDADTESLSSDFHVIIGHRRLAAAKLAGIETVPCKIVSKISKKEQVSIMLEENMQRGDLTIWEQAQGFQMMLDLGETEDTIAEKTGFSKKTIRHRLNIAKLDSKTLMEKERQDGYQLTLTDMYELEKIKDIKARNKILKESTDSRDLARRAINAQKEQKRQENMKLYVAMMKKLGLKKAPAEADSEFYTDKWERMESYSLDKEPPKTMKFKDNGEPMFYLERYGTLYVIRKAKKAKKVLTPEEEAKKQNMRNKKQIKAILKEAANTRKVFIEGILSGRIKKVTDEKQVEADLFEQMMDWETFTGHNKLIEFFVGCEVYNAPEEEKEAARKKMQGLSVLQKLLCLVSAMVADADLVEWNYTYNTVRGEKVKAFYGILEQYGFQFPNDEEKGVVEGTSDLYVKKEGAK